MNLWVELLGETNTGDDTDVFEAESVSKAEPRNKLDENDDIKEAAFEVMALPLPALPLENNSRYPQEDAAYF